MTASLVGGPYTWGGKRDDEGHREFTVSHLVKVSDPADDPYIVMQLSTLPQIGDTWNLGNGTDIWAFCWPTMEVKILPPQKEGEPPKIYRVDQKFSTRPIPGKRCQDTAIEDPLLEPDKITGGFVRFSEEYTHDRFGSTLASSSHELFRGPQVEFDRSRGTIKIEQNRSSLEYPLLASMQDTVNNASLWGFAARCIKFNLPSFEKVYYGECSVYFKRHLEFEIRVNTDGSPGFDRDILDEGTKVLKGHWDTTGNWIIDTFGSLPANRNNPNHFIAFHDQKGNQIRAILDGLGLPADVMVDVDGTGSGTAADSSGPAYYHHVEAYDEANFLLLDIPSDIETP